MDRDRASRRASRRRLGLLLSGAVVLLLTVFIRPALATSVATPSQAAAGASDAGCSPTRLATAYGTNDKPLTSQPSGAPVPCLVPTGYATIETHIVVTNNGTILDEPAIPTPGELGTAFLNGLPGPHGYSPFSEAGLATSSDQGAKWTLVKPGGDLGSANDNGFYVDPVTGRVFLEWLGVPPPQGGEVPLQDQTVVGNSTFMVTPDDGKTWYHNSLTGFVFTENARFTSAPPPPGQTQPVQGYPDVTYWCGNQNVGLTTPVITNRQCYRSLDGGISWEFRSILFTNAVPASPECQSPPDFSALDGYYPQGADDGSLYVMVQCGPGNPPASADNDIPPSIIGAVYLLRNTDEASSWSVLQQPRSSSSPSSYVQLPVPKGVSDPELRLATANGQTVFVLAYEATTTTGPAVLLQTAALPPYTPHGTLATPLSWTRPVALTPPGLSSIDRWAVAVRGARLALSYVAATNGAAGTVWNGYLTTTANVVSLPAMWTAMVNDPKQPLSTSAPAAARDDFIGVTIGPDGTPWASYFFPCASDPNAPTDPACEGQYVGGHPVPPGGDTFLGGNDRGMVASLRPPPST